MRHDLATIRSAMAARLGDQRPLSDRIRLVGVTGLGRVFLRADRLALALRARCFSWNPTLPPLSFGRVDYPALVVAVLLALTALV
jgi:biotin transport system permease protein